MTLKHATEPEALAVAPSPSGNGWEVVFATAELSKEGLEDLLCGLVGRIGDLPGIEKGSCVFTPDDFKDGALIAFNLDYASGIPPHATLKAVGEIVQVQREDHMIVVAGKQQDGYQNTVDLSFRRRHSDKTLESYADQAETLKDAVLDARAVNGELKLTLSPHYADEEGVRFVAYSLADLLGVYVRDVVFEDDKLGGMTLPKTAKMLDGLAPLPFGENPHGSPLPSADPFAFGGLLGPKKKHRAPRLRRRITMWPVSARRR